MSQWSIASGRDPAIDPLLRPWTCLSPPSPLSRPAPKTRSQLTIVINTGPTPLCLFTVYAPAEHAETTVHKTKEEGDELEEAGKDEAPEWAKKH